MFIFSNCNFFSFLNSCFTFAFVLLTIQPTLSDCVFPTERFQVQCPTGFDRWFSNCEPQFGPRAYYMVCLHPQPPRSRASFGKALNARFFTRPGWCREDEICVNAPFPHQQPRFGGAHCVSHEQFLRIALLATSNKNQHGEKSSPSK